MEVTTRTVSRNRCGRCRQEGHNRTRCPHDSSTATSLAVAFRQEERARDLIRVRELRARQAALNSNADHAAFRTRVYEQVTDMQRRLQELTGGAAVVPPRNVPTVREVKIQEILFDRAQEIPDGLYKELMDALVIRV